MFLFLFFFHGDGRALLKINRLDQYRFFDYAFSSDVYGND